MQVKSSLFVFLSICSLQSTGQFSENFNSRLGIASAQVRGFLQTKCWNLVNFESGQPVLGMEGDGALSSKPASDSRIRTGIYSPVLDISKQVQIKFQYKTLGKSGSAGHPEYLRIVLASTANEPMLVLDSITLPATAKTMRYNRVFENLPAGNYRLFINYSNKNGGRIAIDDMSTNLKYHYAGGCNAAPVAGDDVLTADANGTVQANLALNDRDPNNDHYSLRIESVPEGVSYTVTDNKLITFQASNAAMSGAAKIRYRNCEDQPGGLCSEPATVTIQFPSPQFPSPVMQSSLVQISGEYLQSGRINLAWTRNDDSRVSEYSIERSLDGKAWAMAGTVDATSVHSQKKKFQFLDAMNKNVVIKNDIYYRIRECIKGQEDIISKLLVVRVYNTQAVRMVSVTPNPLQNDINLTLQLNHDAMTSMKIVGDDGVEVMRKVMKASAGLNNIVLEGTSELTAGNYMLDVTINSKERMLVSLVKE